MKDKKMKNVKFKALVPVQVECNAFIPEEYYNMDIDTLTLEKWIKDNVYTCIASANVRPDVTTHIFNEMGKDCEILKISYEPIVETLKDLFDVLPYPRYENRKVYLNYKDLGLLPLNSSSYYVENEVIYFEGHDLNVKDNDLTLEVFVDAVDSEICSGDWMDSNDIYDCSIIICRNDRLVNGDVFDIHHNGVEEFTIKSVLLSDDDIILDLE